jgi:hypothetical protein
LFVEFDIVSSSQRKNRNTVEHIDITKFTCSHSHYQSLHVLVHPDFKHEDEERVYRVYKPAPCGWMSGKNRRDRIRNDTIRERVGVAPIVEKLVENRLRWFGHVERRLVDAVVRRVDQMEKSQVKRGRGRLRKTIRETVRKDLEVNELDPNMIYDRTLWHNLIHVADPT